MLMSAAAAAAAAHCGSRADLAGASSRRIIRLRCSAIHAGSSNAAADISHRGKIAVVTGGNKGVGFEVCRQLALAGVTVILTARDPAKGAAAAAAIRKTAGDVVFHRLDVRDAAAVASLADFVACRYGKLDILVNNAAITGVEVDAGELSALNIDAETWTSGKAADRIKGIVRQTYDLAVACLDTNYRGTRRVTEACLPLLRRSSAGGRVVIASSLAAELKRMPNKDLRDALTDVAAWDEDRIEALLEAFLEDVKRGRIEEAGWPAMMPAYSVSKMVLNLYTRILARRHPEMRINCVRPGFVKTDMTWGMGLLSPEEGARGPVMLALLPGNGASGCYFDQTDLQHVW